MPLLMLLIFLIVTYKTLCLRVIRFEKMASVDDFGIEEDIVTSELGNLGLTAAGFDYFNLKEPIEFCIGKLGSHVKFTSSEIIKLLCCQVLNVPYQSLYGTQEYYRQRPMQALLNRSDVTVEQLDRNVLSRTLDSIAEYGPEKLFLKCASNVAQKLGLKVESVHLDSTSFHYSGEPRVEEGCNIVLDQGYSRDNHPELGQINELMLCDELSKLPIFETCVSGHVHDKTSFKSVITSYWKSIKAQFRDLRYLTGDSALCTSQIAKEAKEHGIKFITRIPDKNGEALSCREMLKEHPDRLELVDKENPNGPKAMWCGEGRLGDESIKKLLVQNELLYTTKKRTVEGKAKKELKKVNSELKKLCTQPCKCKADAELAVKKITDKMTLVCIDDKGITYEEVLKYSHKGRHAKDEKKETVAVKVHAQAMLNETAIEQKIKEDTYFVICTNDLERKWTMSELIGIYKKQSVVERNWRCLKDKKLLINAIYLELPSRINALMWIMSIALLIYTATEYLMRIKMKENSLTIPSPDHKVELEKPSLMRVYQFIGNSSVTLVYNRKSGQISISGLPLEVVHLLIAMGDEWCRYYIKSYYAGRTF